MTKMTSFEINIPYLILKKVPDPWIGHFNYYVKDYISFYLTVAAARSI